MSRLIALIDAGPKETSLAQFLVDLVGVGGEYASMILLPRDSKSEEPGEALKI